LLFLDVATTFLAFGIGRYLVPDAHPTFIFTDLFIYLVLLFRIFWLFLFNSYDLFSLDLRLPTSFRTFLAESSFALLVLVVVIVSPLRYKGADYGRKAIFSALILQIFLSFFLRSLFY
ncbi:MAG: hypothetical protein QXI89_01780, partial [Candidatus Anstonellales archaeon]